MKIFSRLAIVATFLFAVPVNAETELTGVWMYEKTHLHVPGGGRFGGEEGTYIDVYEEATENLRRIWIFTDGYYSFFFATAEDGRPMRSKDGEKMPTGRNVTNEQKLAEYATLDVEAGTYTVEGDQLNLVPTFDKIPDREDGRHNRSREFAIEGDMLRISSYPSESRPELATHEYYRRVE